MFINAFLIMALVITLINATLHICFLLTVVISKVTYKKN
jgi:hypothetical protein